MTDSQMVTTPTLTINGDVTAWVEKIGPSRAEQLTQTYKIDYRKYSPSYAEGLARDMSNGRWNFDGSPIRMDINNNLFDGNHRLHAVMLSGTEQTFLFVGGLPEEAYNTTDTGRARNYADTLRRRGYQNVSQRGALQKLIHRWENGKSLDDTKRMTNSELDEIMYRHIDSINHAIGNAVGTARKIPMPTALVSFSWWVLSTVDIIDAKTFLVSLADGENLKRGMPVYTLRERLRNDYEYGHTRNEYMHLVFQAWNYFREGREDIFRLSFPRGNVTRQNMESPK